MTAHIGSLISLILLVPIIYFLPIGFSKKGKWLLVLTALVAANIALIAKLSFPIWQAALFIFLLIAVSAYFIDKRFGSMVYDTNVHLENEDELEELDRAVPQSEPSSFKTEQQLMDHSIDVKEPDIIGVNEEADLLNINNEKESIQESTDLSLTLEEEPFETDSSLLLEEEPFEIEEVDLLPEEVTSNNQEVDLREFLSDDEIDFLNSREDLLDDFIQEEDTSSNIDSQDRIDLEKIDYMDEIEDLIQNDDSIEEQVESVVIETEDYLESHENDEILPPSTDDELDFSYLYAEQEVASTIESIGEHDWELVQSEDENSNDETKVLEDDWLELDELFITGEKPVHIEEELTPEFDVVEDAAAIQTSEEELVKNDEVIQDLVETSILEDNEDTDEVHLVEVEAPEFEEINTIQLEEQPMIQQQNLLSDEHSNMQVIENQDKDDAMIEEENMEQDKDSALQQQLISTIIDGLQIAGKQMPAEEYESLVKEHLHEGLTSHDYYTFSSLLIQHYVKNNETDKLKDLLFHLKEKFEQYPILEMEIQYLYERYCKN